MLKNILKLDGAQQLSKKEQKEINGGIPVGCAYQTWYIGAGGNVTICKTNTGGYNYSFSNGTCRAYFCNPIEPIS